MGNKTKLKPWVNGLERWYQRHHRDLPWRASRDPYRIWISEVMLQQTQVAAVLPYYAKFIKNWPTVEELAKAKESDVLAAWSGLGYYSRARNLKRGATHLLENHAGKFPKDRNTLLTTPGIGPYTAGAILSIAFDQAEPIVDGNVQRVFARFFGEKRAIEEPAVQKQFWHWASEWVHAASSPNVLNQSLMELGALICTKASPACNLCPLKKDCYSYKHECQDKLPRRKPKRKPVELWWLGVVLEHKNNVFLKKNKKGEWWHDLWDFPVIKFKDKAAFLEAEQTLKKKYPRVRNWQKLAPQKHTVTHHRIHFQPYTARLTQPLKKSEGRWHSLKALERLPISSLVKKVMRSYY